MCLRMLKESNKSRFGRYSRQKKGIDHILYYLSGLSRAHFSDNLSRNSCIKTFVFYALILRLGKDNLVMAIYLLI